MSYCGRFGRRCYRDEQKRALRYLSSWGMRPFMNERISIINTGGPLGITGGRVEGTLCKRVWEGAIQVGHCHCYVDDFVIEDEKVHDEGLYKA